MDSEKINLFISTKGDNFPSESLPMIRERLQNVPSDRELSIMAMNYTNPILNLIISIFVGEFGVDRFIIGDIGLGFGKLALTCCCGVGLIWWFVDLFLIIGATKKKNMEKLLLAIG